MPKVPSGREPGLGQNTSKPEALAHQKYQTDVSMFSGGKAKALGTVVKDQSSVSGVMQEQQQKERDAEDNRAMLEVESQVRDFQNEAMLGETGVFSMKGKASFGAKNAIRDEYAKFTGKAMEGRRLSAATSGKINAYLAQTGQMLEEQAGHHEAGEKFKYEISLYDSRIEGLSQDAATFSGDNGKIIEQKGKIGSTVKKKGGVLGWSGEMIKAETFKQVSTMHTAVVDRMLVNNKGISALVYLNTNADEVDDTEIATLQESAIYGAIKQASGEQAGLISAKGLTQKEALAEAHLVTNSDLNDAQNSIMQAETVKRVDLAFVKAQNAEKAYVKEKTDEVFESVHNGGEIDDVPPSVVQAIGPDQFKNLKKIAENRDRTGKVYSPIENPAVMKMVLGMSDDEIVDTNLTRYTGDVTEGQFNQLKARQKSAQANILLIKENPGIDAKVRSVITKFEPQKFHWRKSNKSARVRDEVLRYARSFEQNNKRLPSDAEIRKETARLMLNVDIEIENTMFDLEGRAFEVQDEPLVIDYSNYKDYEKDELAKGSGVPKKNQKMVLDFLNEFNQPITLRNMRLTYMEMRAEIGNE